MSTIGDLFDRDPLSLTREDLKDIIAYYRERRLQFKLGDKRAGAPEKKSKEKLSLGDVGELDL